MKISKWMKISILVLLLPIFTSNINGNILSDAEFEPPYTVEVVDTTNSEINLSELDTLELPELDVSLVRSHIGLNLHDQCVVLYPDVEYEKLAPIFREHYNRFFREIDLFPGTLETLQHLLFCRLLVPGRSSHMIIICNLFNDNLMRLNAPKACPSIMSEATKLSSVITIQQWHTDRHLLHKCRIALLL